MDGRRRKMGWATLVLGGALAVAQPGPSANGQAAAEPKPRASQPKAVSASPRSPEHEVAVPDADRILFLIRAALLTLNDALQTGNFTVLRDVGSPAFREANTPARLSHAFSGLMAQGVDLSAVAVMAPQLGEVPAIDQRSMLRLKGHFHGQPVRIDFEIVYEAVAGRWRLFSLSVNPVRAQAHTLQPRVPAGAASPAASTQPTKLDPPEASRLKFIPERK